MKNNYLCKVFIAALIILSAASPKHANAQYVALPDTNFRNWLQMFFPSCMSGGMLDTTCAANQFQSNYDCSNFNIYDLEGIQYFTHMGTLRCEHNHLTILPQLRDGLYYLICGYNPITSLPPLPSTLGILDCYSGQLTSLPSLPAGMVSLSVAFNQITSLPPLPPGLKILHLEYNQLDSLPALPSTITDLRFLMNSISSLPALPDSLTYLDCRHNLLTQLPAFPPQLKGILCDYNQLTWLPAFPDSLCNVECTANLLTSLPDLPDSMNRLWCGGNPLTCLPRLNILNQLDFTNTQVHCIPNHATIQQCSPLLSSLPLCQISNGCPITWNISGKVFQDINQDCIMNGSDSLLKSVRVWLDSANVPVQMALTNEYGEYNFRAGLGDYTVHADTSGIPFNTACPASFYYNVSLVAGDSLDSLIDYGMQCKPGFDFTARSIAISQPFRANATRIVYLGAGEIANFFNGNCATGINGVVQAVLDGPATYSYSLGRPPSSANSDTITWNISDFSTVNPLTDFEIAVHVNSTATIGNTICIHLSIYTLADNDSTNNTLTSCYPVIGSYDPNEKLMEPSGVIDTSNQWFTFTVFFQNTGNAAAEEIYILDTLDNDLDASTFTYLSSSHNAVIQLLPGNVLRFNYANINLPDSAANEPASHGYVQYKVKRKANLPVNTVISNTAYIYFDFNPAIVTNTVSATLSTSVGMNAAPSSNAEFEIYPNPTKREFRIQNINFKQGRLELFNALGENVYSQKINSQLSTVNCQLSSGVYFVMVTTENGIGVKRLVIE